MKVLAKQVYCDVLDFTPGTSEKMFTLATGRRNGVIEVVCIAVNPRGTDKMTGVCRVVKIRGVECDLDAPVDVGHPSALSWYDPIYLAEGHEIGLRIDGEKVDSTCRVFIHYLWHSDTDYHPYLKGTG